MSDRIAIVTGAGSGIGRAAALALADDGWLVALAGRRLSRLEETAALRPQLAHRFVPVPTDVADAASVASLFRTVVGAFGRVDLLFNNAGVGAPATPIEEVADTQWLEVVNVNLTGMFFCLREAFRQMRQQSPQGGRIINNGSVSAHVPRPQSIAYTATKHGVTGLTRSAALEGRRYNIACGQIDIGNALTELSARMAEGVLQANGTTSVEPLIDVEHVGRAVAHMAALPLDANVQFMTLMATQMPYIGRG
jgi:NAD(P)-dependent dehydrogenase (short-subunit alcohol dehydrogenase family)